MESVSGYREVIPDQTKPEKWKEFTLNTGGTPSTLQDIKVQQRAGGYTYRTCPSRFIFWRTNHDVLELVEESLGVNLAWNHIKYRFKDTPILDGVTIHETYNSVIVLVCTVSSAHRLVFPHPDKLTSQGAVPEANIASVFSEATLSAARDPTTYHILTSSPNLPHTSASCLTKNGDALFALALGTGMILLVHLEPLSGVVTCKELFQDTRVPRFLSGFSDALLGRHAEDSVAVSMVLQSVNKTVYLFGVCRDGQLRVWNCDKGNFVIAHDVSNGAAKYAQGGQNHCIRKALGPQGELYLCVFLGFTNGSKLVVVSPKFESGIFKFCHVTTVNVPEGHDLVEVWLGNGTMGGQGGGVWCIWMSAQGEWALSHMPLPATEWIWTQVQPAPPLQRHLSPALDPRQAYLQAIFEPGLFSYNDISRALSIYKRSSSSSGSSENEIAPGDLKQSVCLAVEAEIQVEVSEYELTDDEYLDVADRCWSRLYSCCVQYLQTGTAALGLFWLPATNCIAIVKKTGFSLLRPMDPLEALYLKHTNHTTETCGYLMKALKELDDTPEMSAKLEAALDSNTSVEKAVEQIAAEIRAEQKSFLQALHEFENSSNIEEDVRTLTDMLQLVINDCEKGDCDENIFTSDLGVSAVITTLQQLTDLRFDLCKKLVLLIEVSNSDELKANWAENAVELCKRLWTLKWVSQAQFSPGEGNINLLFNSHTPALLLHRFLISHQLLTYSDLLSSAAAVSEAVWLESTCKVVAEFLLNSQQYLLLQQLAHHVPHSSWNLILAQAFLEMGEPHKAYDLAANETEDYFKVIQMFERHDLPHYVIDLAKNATETIEVDPDSPDLATLHSILFLHHLKLGHWESAYHSMETNPELTRRVNCLGQLVTELVNTRNIKTLLEFPYCGLLTKLETFLETRARSLDISEAALYYNTLFALYTKHENFKRAARVMYEHGLRSENTRAQCQCYGACLNALQLVSSDNAWIVKPSSDPEDDIEVLELKDIRREYELSKARCLLKDCSPDSLPAEVVLRCVAEGFYKMALQLCHLFRLGYEQPLEALSTACITIANHDKPWDWLLQNEISDVVVGDASAGAVAWRLLEQLLFQYEQEGLTSLHQVVASNIMSHSAFLPHWLHASYKRRNPGELIRLYIRYGNLQEASELSELLLKATLGVGKEHFNLKNSLLSTAPGLWLPLNTIDSLISELQHQPSMLQEMKDLMAATDKFLETASRVSNDKIAAVYTH